MGGAVIAILFIYLIENATKFLSLLMRIFFFSFSIISCENKLFLTRKQASGWFLEARLFPWRLSFSVCLLIKPSAWIFSRPSVCILLGLSIGQLFYRLVELYSWGNSSISESASTCLFRLSSLLTGIVCLSLNQSLFLAFLSISVSNKTPSYSWSQIQILVIIRKTLSLTNLICKNLNDFPANE